MGCDKKLFEAKARPTLEEFFKVVFSKLVTPKAFNDYRKQKGENAPFSPQEEEVGQADPRNWGPEDQAGLIKDALSNILCHPKKVFIDLRFEDNECAWCVIPTPPSSPNSMQRFCIKSREDLLNLQQYLC